MEDENKKCSICGQLCDKESKTPLIINKSEELCNSGEEIYLCKDCFDKNINMTDKGMFLIYHGSLSNLFKFKDNVK